MGADFPDKAKKTFEKCWDRGLQKLNQPQLFDSATDVRTRTLIADLAPGAECGVGDALVAEISGTSLVVRRDFRVVAECRTPPSHIAEALAATGAACAVARIEQVNVLSNTVEVSLANE